MNLMTDVTASEYLFRMDLDPVDFFPGYDPYYCSRRRSRGSTCASLCTHLLAIIVSVGICTVLFYYYETYYYNKSEFGDLSNDKPEGNQIKRVNIDEILKEMEILKESMEKTNTWRKHLDELFTKIYLQQETIFNKKVEEALDLYDADKIGLFDYASIYACGSIISTPDTRPYPANTTLSFFKLLKVDLMSNPESILQPSNVPGNCFAFYGTEGRIRIKLGKKIRIQSVTMDHMKLLDESSSAPKDFEVLGLHDPDDDSGISLGRFSFNINGRPYQTFEINQNLTYIPFEHIELHILNNYGKRDFTCVYRFRVHNRKRKVCLGCKTNK